jgi:hypothetical protein
MTEFKKQAAILKGFLKDPIYKSLALDAIAVIHGYDNFEDYNLNLQKLEFLNSMLDGLIRRAGAGDAIKNLDSSNIGEYISNHIKNISDADRVIIVNRIKKEYSFDKKGS